MSFRLVDTGWDGAQIRGVRHLHAKLYLLGASRAIVTSANLTAWSPPSSACAIW